MARSKCIEPYEVDPDNPMLRSEDSDDKLTTCGHADLVETQKGEWYLVHLCSRPRKGKSVPLGRELPFKRSIE